MPREIPQQAREDFDKMVQIMVPFAEQMLKQHGEFYPFGAMVTSGGELVPCETDDLGEMPDTEQVMAVLVRRLHNESLHGSVRSVVTCHDGRITLGDKKSDVIIVNLEHIEAGSYKGYITYNKGLFGKYRFGELSLGACESRVFRPSGAQ